MDLFGLGKTSDWKKSLQAVKKTLAATPSPFDWANSAQISAAAQRSFDTLTEDLKILKKDARFVFVPAEDGEDLARNNIDLLRQWQLMGQAPTLVALCVFAAGHFKLQITPDVMHRLLIAAVLGEVENNLSFHNNLHYKKVLLQLLQLISAQNEIYEGTDSALTHEQIALMMTAACIHDLGHDGMGNTVKGVFHHGRLERRSIEIAHSYFAVANCADESSMMALRAMLLSTDVSPLGDPANLMNQMKSAWRHHFMGVRRKTELLNLDPELRPLERNPVLATMCLLLHEADIATSAGINYEVTKYETAIYAREIGDNDPRPQYIIDFLNDVCQRRMLSDAGQKLYAANMARIYALAGQDVRNGNQPLPAPEHAEFVLSYNAESSTPKTIN